jgi:hypothetical protein
MLASGKFIFVTAAQLIEEPFAVLWLGYKTVGSTVLP